MYIKIGTDPKPLGLKVAGGFIVDTPILKIISYQTQINPYTGTPPTAFSVLPSNFYPEKPTVSVTVVYYKSYVDYLGCESQIIFNSNSGLVGIDPHITNEVTLESNYYGLVIDGEVTLAAVYEALKNKIGESFKVIAVIAE